MELMKGVSLWVMCLWQEGKKQIQSCVRRKKWQTALFCHGEPAQVVRKANPEKKNQRRLTIDKNLEEDLKWVRNCRKDAGQEVHSDRSVKHLMVLGSKFCSEIVKSWKFSSEIMSNRFPRVCSLQSPTERQSTALYLQ